MRGKALGNLTPKNDQTGPQPAYRLTPEEGWAQILAHAFAEFLNTKPVDFAEGLRRILVMMFLVFLSGGMFIITRHPHVLGFLNPTPINERSMIERLAEDKNIKDRAFEEMENWFYTHRPHGMMLVSWEELRTFTGVWVRPAERLKGKVGVHEITPDIRQLSGPFIFGECASVPSSAFPGKTMVACPIYNEFDVWGYVAAVVDPGEVSVEYTLRSIHALAYRLNRLIY